MNRPLTNYIENFVSINVEIRNDIAYIILNRPPTNKMDALFFDEFPQAVKQIESIKGIKGLIIHGKSRHFSAGADLEDLLSTASYAKNNKEKYQKLLSNSESFYRLHCLSFPVVAVICGVCLGSAFELALFCHIRLCTENALMALPETGFDIMPGCGGTQILPRIIGKAKAIELILSGNNIKASEALESNIVHEIVDKKTILQKAINIIETIDKRNIFNFKEVFRYE